MHSHVPSQSKYTGFGSNSSGGGFGELPGIKHPPSSFGNINSNNNLTGSTMASGGGHLQEAPGLPGEDRNGVERLTGETDDQYVMRQTRIRDEAKARMAAKFGGGATMSSASSSSYAPAVSTPNMPTGGINSGPTTTPSSFPTGMSLTTTKKPISAPTSGNGNGSFPLAGGVTPQPPRKDSKDSLLGDDFFASFGA
jgi:hypothetical protein